MWSTLRGGSIMGELDEAGKLSIFKDVARGMACLEEHKVTHGSLGMKSVIVGTVNGVRRGKVTGYFRFGDSHSTDDVASFNSLAKELNLSQPPDLFGSKTFADITKHLA